MGNGNFPPCHAHQDAPSNYASISLQLVLDGVVHLQSGGGSFEQGGTGYLETPHSFWVRAWGKTLLKTNTEVIPLGVIREPSGVKDRYMK